MAITDRRCKAGRTLWLPVLQTPGMSRINVLSWGPDSGAKGVAALGCVSGRLKSPAPAMMLTRGAAAAMTDAAACSFALAGFKTVLRSTRGTNAGKWCGEPRHTSATR